MSTTSYDLSPLYRHSTSILIPSTSLLVSLHSSKLILRSFTTLQIIRTWSLPAPPTSSSSGGGDYSITLSPSPSSSSSRHVLIAHPKLDTITIIDLDQSEPVGRIKIGKVEGFGNKLVWDSIELDRILVWAENRLRINLLSLKNPQSVYQIQSPKSSTSDSYSFSENYFALLERHENRDCIAIYDPKSNWSLLRNIVISDPTSDLTGLKWSPNGGKYLVTWSSITHYYLHIFTPDGRLIKTFEPYISITNTSTTTTTSTSTPISSSNSNASSPAVGGGGKGGGVSKSRSTTTTTKSPPPPTSQQSELPKGVSKEISSYVGLGIRVVEWSPDGNFLAIGGYDGKIRVLSKVLNWNVVVELSCPNKITTNSSTIVWREPSMGWVEKTLGKGIITFNQVETSIRTPYLVQNDLIQPPVDSSSKPFPKMGWSKLVWSDSGEWLIGYNQSYPNHLYVFKFLHYTSTSSRTTTIEEEPSHHRQRIPHVKPRLQTLILLNSPPKNFGFKPTSSSSSCNEETTLIVLSGSNSFIVWTATTTTTSTTEEEEEEEKVRVMVEGVGIPTPESTSFNPNILEFSSSSTTSTGERKKEEEEEKEDVMLLGEKGGMFCLVYPVKENHPDGDGGGDRTWIEGEDY
ncbi:hypothetical protein JCM5350_001341 [Sporobolomyces pararoseus]